MGQAYDGDGNRMGEMVFGDSLKEVADKLLDEHAGAAELRIQKLRGSIDEIEGKNNLTAQDIIKRIDAKLGDGWCSNLMKALEVSQ